MQINKIEMDLNRSVENSVKSLRDLIENQRSLGLNDSMKQRFDVLFTEALNQVTDAWTDVASISLKADVGSVNVVVDQTSTIGFYRLEVQKICILYCLF